MMGREKREVGYTLSPRLRIYSPRLEEVRLTDGLVTVTVIFGQRVEVGVNGREKRRVRVWGYGAARLPLERDWSE